MKWIYPLFVVPAFVFFPAKDGWCQSLRIGPLYASGERLEAQLEFDPVRPLPARNQIWLIEDGKATVPASDIKTARESQRGMAALIAVDVSGSMKGAPLQDTQTALQEHMNGFTANDSVALVSFADEAKLESDFDSPGSARLQTAIQNLQARGKHTLLYDALSYCVELLGKTPLRRRELIVISDGMSDGSKAQIESVTERARQAGVTIDGLGRGEYSPDASNSLYRLARESGGRLAYAGPGQMSEKLKLLQDQIESMPVVTFDRKLNPSGAKTKRLAVQLIAAGSAPEVSGEIEMAVPATLITTQSASFPWMKSSSFPWLIVVLAVLAILAIAAYFWAKRKKEEKNTGIAAPGGEAEKSPPEVTPETPRKHPHRVTQFDGRADTGAPVPGSGIALVVISGPMAGRKAAVSADGFRIGAAADNEFALGGDDYVSSHHAQIDSADGGFVVRDAGSRSGTWVNGTKISGVHPLKPGDVIKIGRSELEVSAGRGVPVGIPR